MREDLLDSLNRELLRTPNIKTAEGLLFIAAAYFFIKKIMWLNNPPMEGFEEFDLQIYSALAVITIVGLGIPVVYALLWRTASIKFDEGLKTASPSGAALVLLYLISNLIVVICFIVALFYFVGVWDLWNKGGDWLNFLFVGVQAAGIGALYAYYLYNTNQRAMDLTTKRKMEE